MALGLGVTFIGYTLMYFGVCSLKGPGVGLLDLVIPGRTVTIPGGGGGSAAKPTTPYAGQTSAGSGQTDTSGPVGPGGASGPPRATGPSGPVG